MRRREAGGPSKPPQEDILLCRYDQKQLDILYVYIYKVLHGHMKGCCEACPLHYSSLPVCEPQAALCNGISTHYALSGGGAVAQGQLYDVSSSGSSHNPFPISNFLKQIIQHALTPDI